MKTSHKFLFLVFAPITLLIFSGAQAQNPLSCKDSDGGVDYYTAGQIQIAENSEWQDKCLNSIQLQEGYCDPLSLSGYKTIVFSCPSGCQNGVCQKNLNLVSPNKEDLVKEGEYYLVEWDSEGLEPSEEVIIFLKRSDGPEKEIAKLPVNKHYFRWQIETDFKDWISPDSPQNKEAKISDIGEQGAVGFRYKILIKTVNNQIGDSSDDYFTIVEKPLIDLELGDKVNLDAASFQIQVCNLSNKNLDFPDKTIKGKVIVSVPVPGSQEEKQILKTLPLASAKIDKLSCVNSDFLSYADFEMNQNREYPVKVELDPYDNFDELYEIDEKEYKIVPEFGFKVSSPNGGERWGIGSRRRITIEATGPQVWTKIEMKAVDKATAKEYKIDTIHIQPPSIDYWWTIPQDVAPGEEYVIKVVSSDAPSKEDESDNYFAIIEPTFACNDSDKGKNYYQAGSVAGIFAALKGTSEERSAVDFCLNENTLVEYLCKYDYVYSEHYKCPYGCEQGICKKAIKLVFPDGTEKLEEGKTYTIKWEAAKLLADAAIEVKLVDSRYKQNPARAEILIAETPNTGMYSWTVPSSIEFTTAETEANYKIIVSAADGAIDKYDESDKNFSIVKLKTQIAKKNSPPKISSKNIPSPSPTPTPVVNNPLKFIPSQSNLANLSQELNKLLEPLKRLFWK